MFFQKKNNENIKYKNCLKKYRKLKIIKIIVKADNNDNKK